MPRSPWRGVAFKAYSIIDIYSRKLVGYRVEDREVDELAKEMFQEAIAREGRPEVVHADSGPAMRSTVLKDYLGKLKVTQTHNRPRVSNDNPYSESEFRTMKYRPNYPGTFEDLEQARSGRSSSRGSGAAEWPDGVAAPTTRTSLPQRCGQSRSP